MFEGSVKPALPLNVLWQCAFWKEWLLLDGLFFVEVEDGIEVISHSECSNVNNAINWMDNSPKRFGCTKNIIF